MVPTGQPRPFAVYKNVTSIGSGLGNDVAVDSKGVAEFHAQLVFDGKEFNLEEVDRVGEILLNGKKKRRGRVIHGDRITVGDAELAFSIFDIPMHDSNEDAASAPANDLNGLRKLFDFSQSLMMTGSVEGLLERLLDSVIEVTHADKGFLILLRDGEPRVTVARNLSQGNLPDGVKHLSDSILQRVIETRRPLIVSDALHDTVWKTSESVMNLQLVSVMCAPLVAQGDLLGVLYVGNDRVVNLFEETSLDVFTVFAGQASLILQNALLLDQVKTDRDELKSQLERQQFGDIVGACAPMLEVYRKVEKVATTDINVLITGETGTGKELIAREIHRRSPRAKGPFVVVNCGAIPENLMESELFGHVRGAFTGAVATRIGKFQAANLGTLFLDEIGELPLALQVKLLRALQEREITKVGDSKSERIDIRVVAATNRDLDAEVKKGAFREDLFYRLNVVNLHLPPLRERGDDVLVLAKYTLDKTARELNSQVKGFTPNALAAVRRYEWPGNVRQLENRIKKAIVLCEKTLLGTEDLELMPEVLQPIMSLTQAREDFQRRYIADVLERNGGNRTKTARDLGVDPRTIFRYLERDGDIETPE